MKTVPLALFALAACLALASCEKPKEVDRSGKLLSMAGEEAANIGNTMDRFSRQLNIADTQLRTGRKPDAGKTLDLARVTLESAKSADFDDFHRIAGWTAISQLARTADTRDLALKASDNAMAALNDVKPIEQRPQYVLSLAGELADLRGKEAAVELLESGAGWAAEIPTPDLRRTALVAFARRMIAYDAFENARTALRHDLDASWRTDVFLALANQTAAPDTLQLNSYANSHDSRKEFDKSATPQRAAAAMPATAPPGTPYVTDSAGGRGGRGGASGPQGLNSSGEWSKDVRFEQVYQNR